MAELDELVQLELDQSLLDIEGTGNVPLPNVPSASLPSRPGKSMKWDTFHCMFGRDFQLFWLGWQNIHKNRLNLFWGHNIQDPILFQCLLTLFFPTLKAKKEEDDEGMEDLQRWAMEAI